VHSAWRAAADAEPPCDSEIDGEHWQVRINDCLAELRYSLPSIRRGRAVQRWSAAWRTPA
jgi:hypothetical protein